jgi:hypothetical protein
MIDIDTLAAGQSGAAFTVEAFEHILAVEGLTLPPGRIAQAVQGYQGLAPALDELRAIALPFLEDVPEPADANRWIEQGGHL